MRVLALSTSPRKGGNSETLLRYAVEGAKSVGLTCESLSLSDYAIAPCRACGKCEEKGFCVIEDDFRSLHEKIQKCDRFLISTPVYFMSLPAQAKALVDRTQSVWNGYELKENSRKRKRNKTASAIVVSAKRGKMALRSIKLIFRYSLDVLGFEYECNLHISGVDRFGEILECPTALDSAYTLGCSLESEPSAEEKKPRNIHVGCQVSCG